MALSREYWDGYRAAQIYVLLEGIQAVDKYPKTDGQYQEGFSRGLAQMRETLNGHIRKERELRKG